MKQFKYMMMAAALVCSLATLLACGQKSQREGDKNAAETSAQAEGKSTAEVTPDSVGYLVKVGDMAPDFTVELTDGSKVTLSTLRGKLVMLQFTASWCGVCRKEMPFIESDIWQKHKDNAGFALFGIDRDEPLAKVQAFARQTKITYPLALDPGADIFALFADRKAGVTRNVLIGRDGKIVLMTRLYNEEEFASLCRKIDELLAE